MLDESHKQPPLTFGGKEIRPTKAERALVDSLIPAAMRAAEETPAEKPVVPLIDEAMAEWKKMLQRDHQIKIAIQRVEELTFKQRQARQAIFSRVKFLRSKAISRVALKRGLRAVPGFKNNESLSKKEMNDLGTKMQELIEKHNLVMPPELISDMRVDGEAKP